MPKSHQVAAIPIRRTDGGMKVLLVTSRETRRWVVPKGWPWRNVDDHDAAAGEAWEEAGVRGCVGPDSIGSFSYDKRRGDKVRHVNVVVYVLEVSDVADNWPEIHERRREWFSPAEAAELVGEPGLKELLRRLE